MFFRRIFTPGLAINSYLLGDEKTKRCVVIDPIRNVIPFIVQAQNGGFDITDILETHVHADFISGAIELKHQLNEKPKIYSSTMGGKEWLPSYADESVTEGSEVIIGDLRLRALHTPGHTPEHLTWICFDDSRSKSTPWFAFTGDCLFVGSVGRPDLLGKKAMDLLAPQLYHTLFERLAPLPDFVEIYPAHGEGSICGKALKTRGSSTLGYERMSNPYFKREPEEIWVKKIKEEHLREPPYCQRVKKLNLKGPSLLSELKTARHQNGANLEDLFLLDIRLPETFASSHFKGAINIPFSPTFAQWAGWMLPEDKPLGLVTDHFPLATDVIDLLRLMGFDQDIQLLVDTVAETNPRVTTASFPMMDPEEVDKTMKSRNLFLVDVRTPEEWRSGHILEAHHIEVLDLQRNLINLPKDLPIALICRSGQRASLAASILEKEGYSVINIRGGMQAWKSMGLPVILEIS